MIGQLVALAVLIVGVMALRALLIRVEGGKKPLLFTLEWLVHQRAEHKRLILLGPIGQRALRDMRAWYYLMYFVAGSSIFAVGTFAYVTLHRLFIGGAFEALSHSLSTWFGRSAAATAILFAGAGFYIVRRSYRMTYACTELVVAVATTIACVSTPERLTTLDGWLPIAGSIYLIVRGLDNFAEGLRKAEEAAEMAAAARAEGE